MNTLITSS